MWRAIKKSLFVLIYSLEPEQEKAETKTHLSSKLGHKNVVVTFSILKAADSQKYECFIVTMKKDLQTLKHFFFFEKL